jgi:magnesium transporter
MNDTPDPPRESDPARQDAAENRPESEAGESRGVLAPAFIAQFVGMVGDGDRFRLRRTIKELHPADAADLLEHLPPDAFRKAIHLLDKDLPAEAVAELSDEMRLAALSELTDAGIATMTEHLDSDDASFLLNDLEEDRRTRILSRVSATDRAAIESSLAFDEESAGRLMQRDLIAVPDHWKVGELIDICARLRSWPRISGKCSSSTRPITPSEPASCR